MTHNQPCTLGSHNLVTFDTCVNLGHRRRSQDNEQTQRLREFPHNPFVISFSPASRATVGLFSFSINQLCIFQSFKQMESYGTYTCLASFSQHNCFEIQSMLCVSIVHSFVLLSTILFYGCTTNSQILSPVFSQKFYICVYDLFCVIVFYAI